jgi:hypothetical protein
MNKWRVGEDRGSKETDGCPHTPKCSGGELSLDFTFFTTTWYRVFILCYEYPTSPLSLCIYKGNKRMGI